mmetsp:Transcript_27748/g.48026  ORF Transcript_27748/g.48026 Transcript_27748/m.48026 type:complete len:394 (+) Transcript_27748:523-1704(+)
MYPATSPIKLSRVQRNDPTLTELDLAYIGGFTPEKVGDYLINDSTDLTMFGEAIGTNTNLRRLIISTMCVAQEFADMAANNGAFFEGFKRSTSIRELCLERCDFSGGMGRDILNGFVANNSNITGIGLKECALGNGGATILLSAVTRCTNLEDIMLAGCDIDDDILVGFVQGIRGLHQLRTLDLHWNNFGRASCEALATLLQDPNGNLTWIGLEKNRTIDDNCATVLTNSLKVNCKLESLCFSFSSNNIAITDNGWDAFSQVLCNTSNVNATYLSNHTPNNLNVGNLTTNLLSLLELNGGTNNNQIATQKILRHHTHLDMEPFLEWDLKVLPLAVSWFDRRLFPKPRGYSQNNKSNVDAKKLSTIYQFVIALPMMFVPPPSKETNKRKIGEVS